HPISRQPGGDIRDAAQPADNRGDGRTSDRVRDSYRLPARALPVPGPRRCGHAARPADGAATRRGRRGAADDPWPPRVIRTDALIVRCGDRLHYHGGSPGPIVYRCAVLCESGEARIRGGGPVSRTGGGELWGDAAADLPLRYGADRA